MCVPRSRCGPAGSVEVLPGARRGLARRQETLAIRWLVNFARQRREPTMAMRLANEILDASNYTGAAIKRKEDVCCRWRSPTRHSPTTAGNPRNVPVGGPDTGNGPNRRTWDVYNRIESE